MWPGTSPGSVEQVVLQYSSVRFLLLLMGVWPMACADRGRERPDVESQMVAFSFHLAGPVVVLG